MRGMATVIVALLLVIAVGVGVEATVLPGEGRIAGTVFYVGGPAPGLPRPARTAGEVVATDPATGAAYDAAVSGNGTFAMSAPSGTYQVELLNPTFVRGEAPADGLAVVRSGGTAVVNIYLVIA